MVTPRNIGNYISEENYLAHYGIKGQKWGLRRYQNPDGTLTDEGKKRAKAEYKKDNQKAFEKGNAATIYSKAHSMAEKDLAIAQKRYERDPYSRTKDALDRAKIVEQKLKKQADASADEAIKHHESLIKKYGKEAISDIRYDKRGRFNESGIHKDSALASILVTTGSLALTALGSPVGVMMLPKSNGDRAREVYFDTMMDVAKEQKQKK